MGLGGGFAGYGHLPAELLANALLVALAARGYRSCAAFHAQSRASAAAAAATTAAAAATAATAATATITITGGDASSDAASATAAASAASAAAAASAASAASAAAAAALIAVAAAPRDAAREATRRQLWYVARRTSVGTSALSPRRAALPSLLLALAEPLVTLSVFVGCLASALSSCDAIGVSRK